MGRDAQASTRLPSDLKREVQEIADKEHRTLSNTIELLLRRGAAAYGRDGRLVQISNRQLDTEEAARMAYIELVAEDVMKVIRDRATKASDAGSKKSKRA